MFYLWFLVAKREARHSHSIDGVMPVVFDSRNAADGPQTHRGVILGLHGEEALTFLLLPPLSCVQNMSNDTHIYK